MKMLRAVFLQGLFIWMVCKIKIEEAQRQVYRIVPRYPASPAKTDLKRTRTYHVLDDPRLKRQKSEWN